MQGNINSGNNEQVSERDFQD